MEAPSTYEIGRVPRALLGADALSGLGAALDGLGGSDVVLVADRGVEACGYVQRVVDALRPRTVTVHLVPWGEPTLDSVDAAADVVRIAADPIVIGVGGGSALDIAKQASVVAQDVAATMNAVENQPMLNNNARPVTETDHGVLAERTVEMWHLLRS